MAIKILHDKFRKKESMYYSIPLLSTSMATTRFCDIKSTYEAMEKILTVGVIERKY